jgi:hypothetical protein
MSGDPQLCASLVSDGFESDAPENKTKLFAISSDFETGFSRLQRFFAVLRPVAAKASPGLTEYINEALTFLEAHRDRYLLLETIELDTMEEGEASALRACVEKEIENCLHAGLAVDALPDNIGEAVELLKKATQSKMEVPFDAFYGLRLDDDCDNTRDDKTEYPLGLGWTDVLYVSLWNRAKFEENQRAPPPSTETDRLNPDVELFLNTHRETLNKGLIAVDKALDLVEGLLKDFPQLSYDTSKLKALQANYLRGLERLKAGIIDGKATDGTGEIIREAREWLDKAIAQIQQSQHPNKPHNSSATNSPHSVSFLAQLSSFIRNLFK